MKDRLTHKRQLKVIDTGADFYQVRGIDWESGESPHDYETLYLDEALAYFNEGVEKSKRNADQWHHPDLHWVVTHCTNWQRCPDTGDWVNPRTTTVAHWN
mgnify:CR=1 FL=1